MSSALPGGRYFVRGSNGYEQARRATVWNGLLPDRFPDVIVQAHDVADVQSAVRYAGAEAHRIGVCSGGHNWTASHLRDGGALLDVGRLDQCVIDTDRRTAVVGPGKSGSALTTELESRRLFFPTGHCDDICLGGYLLQGGYGWNGRVLGPACESVLGIDVVTAGGEQLYCDPDTNADLYWAALGSGPGFFAVVTAFHLRLHPRPAVYGRCRYDYPLDVADEVFSWARAVSPQVDNRAELQITFARSCPVVDRAVVKVPYAPTSLAEWYAVARSDYPEGHRYVSDNMWTSASAQELLPGLRRIIDTMPPPPSHLLMFNWGRSVARRKVFYGLEDEVNLTLHATWRDPADDARYADWPGSHMAAMAHLAAGISLGDENLGRRPARFATAQNMARLDEVRTAYDPDGRFHRPTLRRSWPR